MTISRILLVAILSPGALALAQSKVTATPPPPGSDPLVQAILAAPDVSSAVEAYARGVAARPAGAVELKRAFVRQTFVLGAPEVADAQAHDLIYRGAADPLVRGVAAYNDAARGNAHAAVVNLKEALKQRRDDPFLLRTAGQVVAWYDSQADHASLSKEDAAGIEWLRGAGKGRDEYADAYAMAAETRESAPAAPTTQRSSAEGSNRGSSTEGASQASSYTGSTFANDGTSSRSSYPYSNDYSQSYGYGYGYGYESGSILAVRDRGFFRNRKWPDHPPHEPPGRGLAGERGAGGGVILSGGANRGPQPVNPGAAPRANSPPPRSAPPPRPFQPPRPPSPPPAPPRPPGP